MQSTEGITVNLSPEDITVLGDALSRYVLFLGQCLNVKGISKDQLTIYEQKLSQSKDLFHRIHKY